MGLISRPLPLSLTTPSNLPPDAPTTPGTVLSSRAVFADPGNPLYPFQRKVKFLGKEGEKKKKDVLEDFKTMYTSWKANTAPMRAQLQQFVSDSEGIAEPGDTPWPGASRIVKPIIETRINIIHSFFMSVIRPVVGRLYSVTFENDATPEERKAGQSIADFFNSNRLFNLMYVNSVDEAFWAVLRDGTVGRYVTWEKEVKKIWQKKTYTGVKEFLDKFPDPSKSGLSAEKFQETISKLTLGEKVSFDIEDEIVAVDRPEIGMEQIKDVVFWPTNVSNQSRTRFLGRRLYRRESELKVLAKQGLYDKAEVDEVIKKTPIKTGDEIDQVQDSIDGVTQPTEHLDYELIHGRYYFDIDDDGIEEMLLVTYAVEAERFIQFDRYPFYHGEDFLKLSWFKRRPKRLIGRGVTQMLTDLQLEASIHARNRINSNAISIIPMLIGNQNLKTQIDPLRHEQRFRPGGIWWVPQESFDKSVKPVDTGKKDFGDSLAEEANLNQNADNILGASELRSGRETPSDPRAPAAKTAILLQQSSVRLDDFIFCFIMKENEVLDLSMRLYYQFGPENIRFSPDKVSQDLKKALEQEIPSAMFNSNKIHLQLSITSLLDNPEYLRQKWEEFYAKYGPEPMLGAIPEVRHTIIGQILLNSPETHGVQLLMPLDQISKALPAPPQMGPDGKPIQPAAQNGAAPQPAIQ